MMRRRPGKCWEINGRVVGGPHLGPLSISEEFAQLVALGDVQHLCMFHIAQ
jgi:hypothetical protein